MTDLLSILPSFPTHKYTHLIPSLEKNQLTTTDLLTLDCVEIAKRAKLPLPDVKALSKAVLDDLEADLEIGDAGTGSEEKGGRGRAKASLRRMGKDLLGSWNTISTLDDELDRALGEGIPTGYITEITGESGAGKTQFLLTLLLAAQLPPPHGLSSSALYISTESSLPTSRLSQLLRTHPLLSSLPASNRPTLNSIISIVTPDLESQDHILRYQVPVAIRRHGIKLVVLDSVAANYRAEFERPGGRGGVNMARRSRELVALGQLLRELARREGVAVVVANQVGDRFSGGGAGGDGSGSFSGGTVSLTQDTLSLDHQQRWFTGWGDIPPSQLIHDQRNQNLKTPSLGLIWATQIACRIALIKKPVYGPGFVADGHDENRDDGEDGSGELVLKRWRRWMKVVFAKHVGPSGWGFRGRVGKVGMEGAAVEFEIRGEGIRAVRSDEETSEASGAGELE